MSRHGVSARPAAAWAVLIAACFGVARPAQAAIDVIPKVVEVEQSGTQVKIINRGRDVEYVSISLSRLLNPGVPLDEERLQSIGDVEHPALYAYPFHLTLAPGQSKSVSLKPLAPVERETVYRLHVKPEVKLLGGERNRIAGGVVVKLGFSILVRQLPAEPHEKISVECDATGARFTATGNVRYRVSAVKVDGSALPDFNVYPGTPIHRAGRSVAVPGAGTCAAKETLPPGSGR
ncbi:hypothetical protein [Burkholderia perseverans]|uniref:hypothetical protein n=1 Tax=Burkholderia perseverans TaxID=2615214 RepID=UPI001FEEDE89|nr:hypothetical protein [Burkholderia perseverans]